MNKDLLNQLPADEQPAASTLTSVAEDMLFSPVFQSDLETQLMNSAKPNIRPGPTWYTKILAATAWTVFALGAILLLNWTLRSLVPNPPVTFEADVRQGKICAGPLTLAHNSGVFLTNQDKTAFKALEAGASMPALHSFAWSPDGKQLALVGTGSTGDDNVYLTAASGASPEIIGLPATGYGYLMDLVWSHDGKQLLTWSIVDNTVVYLMNADGTGYIKKDLGKRGQIFSAPQFAPDDKSIVFLGADVSAGLLQMTLQDSQIRTISTLVQGTRTFAWSPDGSRLAYIETERDQAEVRLIIEGADKGSRVVIGTLPIPKGTFPMALNLVWSPDGQRLVFEYSPDMPEPVPALYLAHVDGSEPIKLVDAAHTPAISNDGRCLAYIHSDQVFLMDLRSTSFTSVHVADLPAGQGPAHWDISLDELQWRP